jgi:hypothetical protein
MKQALLNMNTLGNDLLDYAELFSADTMTELVTIGRKGRLEKQKDVEAQRQHEQELADKQIEGAAVEKDKDRAWESDEKQKDREAGIMREEIQAQGRAADKKADQASFKNISAQTDMALKEMKTNNDIQISQDKLQSQKSADSQKLSLMDEQLKIETRKLDQKDREIINSRYIAEINKN